MRTLRKIALEIVSDWTVINNAATRDALDCMKQMGSVTERFYADTDGYSAITQFLEHSRGWQGQVARRVKKELRQMCGHPRP